jgi:hypothetical protein
MGATQGRMMKLIHLNTGLPVVVGDTVFNFRGEETTVVSFVKPHKPDSSGHVTTGLGYHYVGVYGLEWIDREDRE